MVKKGRQAERTVLRGLLLTSHKDEDTQPQGRRTLYDKELDWPMSPSVCQVASKPWDFFQLIEISAVMIISDSLHPQRDFQWAPTQSDPRRQHRIGGGHSKETNYGIRGLGLQSCHISQICTEDGD